MMRLLRESWMVTRINILSLPRRFWMSLSTIVAVALVVSVLLGFLAMGSGFRATLRGSGAEDIAVMLRAGSSAELNSGVSRDQLALIEAAPGIATLDGKPLVSAELYLVVDGVKRSSGTKANLPLRGIGPQGMALRRGVRLVEGRMFAPGSNELVVGRALGREFAGFELGNTVTFGTSRWTVVGIFDAPGTVLDSEVWADVATVQSLFKRLNFYQTFRARLSGPDSLAALQAYNEADPRLKLDILSEATYFARQAERTGSLIQWLGWPLAGAMALGALAGALNTMLSSVAARQREIATLRAIGYGRIATFIGTFAEALALAAIGGAVGALAAWAFFDGLSATTLSANFTEVVFQFRLTSTALMEAIGLAMAVGVLGGLLPAVRAARLPIALAMSE